MQTKLTLRLEKELIHLARSHAKKSGKSLSQMVADYFRIFVQESAKHEIPKLPLTQKLKGSLHGKYINEDHYYRHLENKYL